jgi:hypothetical protein
MDGHAAAFARFGGVARACRYDGLLEMLDRLPAERLGERRRSAGGAGYEQV